MNKNFLYMIFILSIQNTIVRESLLITLNFKGKNNLTISNSDIILKMFKFKNLISVNNRIVDLRQFQCQTFKFLILICEIENFKILSIDSFVDIILLINLLELNENYLKTDLF